MQARTGTMVENRSADSVPPKKPRDSEWFPGLDGLRGVLFLIVFCVHLPPPWIRPLHGGYIVMEIFFVLSGFLITTVLLREFERKGRIELRLFYARRAVRLLPALVLFAAVVSVASFLDPVLESRGADVRRHALASLSYLYNWIAIYSFNRGSSAPGFIAHLWSLSVEEQFYFVWPVVMLLILRRVVRNTDRSLRDAAKAMVPWLIGGILASNVLRTLIGYVFENGSSYTRANWGTDTRASGMLLGVLVAVVRLGLPEVYAKCLRALPVLGIIAVTYWTAGLWLYPLQPNPFPFAGGFLLSELCGVVMVVCLVERSILPFNWFCETWVMRWLGKISYSGYILHFMVIGRFVVYESTFRFEFPTTLAVTLALASFVFYAIEQPFSKWARKRFRLGR